MDPWPHCPPSVQGIHQPHLADTTEHSTYKSTKPLTQTPHVIDYKDRSKNSNVFEFKEEDSNKSDQPQSTSKVLEPGKAALAEKLHKKIQSAESLESLILKKENEPDPCAVKKEEPSEENEWDFSLNKFMDDLAMNPEGVTSKKSKTLGRRYLQKVQIQEAIDNDLIVPPPMDNAEEEEESEPEPPVKFRGKFKSIKDKKVERLILTYASHSDESATEMIPDEDASDFEEELKREIRSKDKRRGHSRKITKEYVSSGSETERKNKKSSFGRGKNKENKPNNKQDSDFSLSSASASGSDSSSSISSDDSDSEDSESEEEARPRRKGKQRSDSEEEEEEEKKPRRRGRKWDSDSSESEEEVIPRRRTRRGYKSSSEEETYKASQKNKKRKKKQDSSDSEDIPLKNRRNKEKKNWESDEEESIETRRGKKKGGTGRKQQKRRKRDDSDDESDTEIISRKTRGMKKKLQESKKIKGRKRVTSVSSSSDSDETSERKEKKIIEKREKGSKRKTRKSAEDSSENSDIPTKKKSHLKSNLIVESDESEDLRKSDVEDKSAANRPVVQEKDGDETTDKENTNKKTDDAETQEEEKAMVFEDEGDFENDSVIDKLKKIRDEELNRDDVKEMKVWLNEVNIDIKKQLGNLQEVAFRHCWKRPQFGAGDDFLHGWQTDVKKYKELTARFPKKLCQAAKHQGPVSPSKSTPKKGKDRESGKDSPSRQGSSSPAKNTRSKSGIIKTSMAVAEDDRLKVAARPEISSVMQRFFEKVLAAEAGSDTTKGGLASKKFNLGPFPAFGTQRVPTGLTPTPSVAPSMMASDDSDMDSLASLRTDLPASDSIPVSRRSIASSLLKKFGRKYNDKKLNTLYLNKPRPILEATNKPQLLPTPGMPTTEKDLEDMSPDQLKIATFFRKETVTNYRDNFEVVVTKNGINEFTPILYKSRTRNKAKEIQDAATVKSVFGTDIPPHLVKKAEAKKSKKILKKAEKKDDIKLPVKDESSPVPVSRASTPGGSVLAQGDEDDDSELRSERSESVLGESSVPRAAKRVRRKFRKFRSGFDYIRKKKKVKPDDEATPSRKRLPVRKHVNWPEESRDVAAEVRSWVVNKGLGETVLHKAARLQYHDVVVYCAESPDFDINVRDNAGYTPLHEACNRGHLDIAQVLCAHGAHVNAPGYKGMRPLHEAVENGHGELARLLLAYGADPALTTYAGQTCLALSADVQTTLLIEGYLDDLKGRTGEMWYFNGPSRLLDPDEQGCDLFSNIPVSKSVPLCQHLKSSNDTDKQKLESQDLESNSITKPGGDVAQTTSETNLQRKSENLSISEENNYSKTDQHPSLLQVDNLQDLIKKEEITIETKTENNKEEVEKKQAPESMERKESDNTVKKENHDSEDEEGELKEVTLETSEVPLLDVYEIDGRPHKYYLMLELLTLLRMTQAEFIISARTIETLELSVEEFESCAHSCIVGSCSRAIVDTCSCVVLVRVTPIVEKLLGIEIVRL
ncbi:BCL-6 corepressor-like [Homarus americanus]|uniref:BCL-6 corepressor-like n=2 Tax=Homarus americanus TaxID=6706 RepID=A0A8J5NAL2_HOMAM|nr:BCL-6 corepressor-like [Homarus americanus]